MDKGGAPKGARDHPFGSVLIQKARETIATYSMLDVGEPVLVALSGGADSVALLLALRALGYAVSAGHLNHGLRGGESDRDEAFCERLCANLQVPLVVRRADAAAYAGEMRESIETAARDLRYTFFAETVRETGASKIATAHTASDNLETMLFHLTRGTGLDGLCGIPPMRTQTESRQGQAQQDSLDIVRPLIACTRTEVEDFLAWRGQDFVTDSTNLSGDYTRNRIRREVIPVLAALSPKAEQAAADLSARLRCDAAFLREQADELLASARRADGWDVPILRAAHRAIRTRALRRLCEREGLPLRDFSARHVAALEGLLEGENPSAQISLPGGWIAAREYLLLRIHAEGSRDIPVCGQISVQLPFSGTLGQGFSRVTIRRVEKDQLFYKSFNTFYVDCDTIDVPTLVLRNRCAGDRLRLGGGSKTLKKLLVDRKIPRDRRDRLSVLADRHGLIAVQSVGVDVSRRPGGGGIYEIRFEG